MRGTFMSENGKVPWLAVLVVDARGGFAGWRVGWWRSARETLRW
jgi:hypothetical protein